MGIIRSMKLTEISGNITAANTSQVVTPAVEERLYLLFQNRSASADMNIRFGSDATSSSPSVSVDPGAILHWGYPFCPVESLHVVCPAQDSKFSVWIGTPR